MPIFATAKNVDRHATAHAVSRNDRENSPCEKVDSSVVLRSFGDHRIAMSFAIMGLRLGAVIDDEECISVSFPNFLDILREMTEVRLLTN